jgi:hypothetical protein
MAATQAADSQGRGVFEVDQERAPTALELAWTDRGYHGFCADGGTWSAISSAGDLLTDDTPEALNAVIRADHADCSLAVTGAARPALPVVLDEPDQVPGLERFRAGHPELRAWVGGQKVERPTLRGLLDELEEILPPEPLTSSSSGSPQECALGEP